MDRRPEPTTRERLLQAGMAMFAERGFEATRVGDIEAAAGLQPRRGALYNHFESKEALLEEAARAAIARVSTGAAQIDQLDLPQVDAGDLELLRPALVGMAQWFLAMMDEQRELIQLLDHEGGRLGELAELMLHDVIDAGARAGARLIRATVPDLPDPEAATVLLIESLGGFRKTAWTFGSASLGLSDERAIDQWVDLVLALIAQHVTPRPRRASKRRP